MKPRDLTCFHEVASVIGTEDAEVELLAVIKHLSSEQIYNTRALVGAFEWDTTPQGYCFWSAVGECKNPYTEINELSDSEINSDADPSKLTGGSSDYYKVHCTDDLGNDYVTECKHIIKAKNMNFNIGNVFKACFRMGDKESTSVEYDLEKQIFFALEELRRIGSIKNNQEAIKMFHKLIGDKV